MKEDTRLNTKKIKNGLSYKMNGWVYVSVKGDPVERGYAYGYLIAHEMKRVLEVTHFAIYESMGRKWEYFVDISTRLLKPIISEHFSEFYEEMEGFAKGCTEGGTPMTLDEVIAWNNIFILTEGLYSSLQGENKSGAPARGEGGAQERCSAFIAVGDYTEDGKIVVAHNNFSNFIDGQFANIVLDLYPTKGHRMLIQGFPGWIWSGTDFFVTSKGFIGTETTLGGFIAFELNFPISCRIRKAMQYGNTLDDYETYLLEGNSGDYANSWLFGDINTNEIMRIELGLKYHNTERTKNGYFIGFNAAYDPRIRHLESVNSGFEDIRRHQGARRVRLADLMDEYKGKLNIDIAQRILADHYDVYLHKENPCSRTVCAHYELDAREYMSDPSRPKPFQPRGALDGNVCDSTMAKNMSFSLRWGDSCGTPFYKDTFCNEHREWAYLRPYLNDRPQEPWTTFTITNDYSVKTKKTKYLHKKANKKRTMKKSL